MSILIDEESKVKYTELKYYRFQHAETSKATYSLQNRNTTDANMKRREKLSKENNLNNADVNMQRQSKQIEIYRTEILQISIC